MNVDVDPVVESSAPSVKASIARHQAPTMVASSATQVEMDRCSAKAPVMVGGLFSDGFFARAFTGDTG